MSRVSRDVRLADLACSCFSGMLWSLVPWYVVSLRDFLLLSAPSGLLCGNWDFSSPLSRRCSHGYQIQVKSSSLAWLSHDCQAFRLAPPAGSEGRSRALRYRGRGLCQGSLQVDARRFLRRHPRSTHRGRTQQAGLRLNDRRDPRRDRKSRPWRSARRYRAHGHLSSSS